MTPIPRTSWRLPTTFHGMTPPLLITLLYPVLWTRRSRFSRTASTQPQTDGLTTLRADFKSVWTKYPPWWRHYGLSTKNK